MQLISRQGWGARPPNCTSRIPAIDGLVVHYTAANADEQADHQNCAGRVRAIQSFHMSPGWSGLPDGGCDIAYNFLVCKHGFVFEGRGWSHKSGATGNDNSHTIAICFLGDDTKGRDDVTHAGREALANWLGQASRRFPGNQTVKGHRDYMSTTCPGNELYQWVSSGAWKMPRPPRFRVELWARKKTAQGVWKPALVAKSATVPKDKSRARLLRFTGLVAPQFIRLTLARRRPAIRGVMV